jgi:mRNA interferase MazF
MQLTQYSLCIVNLDPTKGHEMQKTRPCAIISPTESNKYLKTTIVAPITSTIRNYKFRVQVNLEKIKGEIALDQIRCIDKSRISKIIAKLDSQTIIQLKSTLREFLVD